MTKVKGSTIFIEKGVDSKFGSEEHLVAYADSSLEGDFLAFLVGKEPRQFRLKLFGLGIALQIFTSISALLTRLVLMVVLAYLDVFFIITFKRRMC